MTPKEIAEKYVYGKHDCLTDKQEVKEMISDIENVSNWIDANKEQPERIYGENYSKNVLAIINGKLGVACYCYNTSEEEEECGYFWANCYGNIDGDAEFESLLP